MWKFVVGVDILEEEFCSETILVSSYLENQNRVGRKILTFQQVQWVCDTEKKQNVRLLKGSKAIYSVLPFISPVGLLDPGSTITQNSQCITCC